MDLELVLDAGLVDLTKASMMLSSDVRSIGVGSIHCYDAGGRDGRGM